MCGSVSHHVNSNATQEETKFNLVSPQNMGEKNIWNYDK